TFGVVIAD
nr:Chain A, PawL-Derived Peptide PLP-13 [Senecio vulgaris]